MGAAERSSRAAASARRLSRSVGAKLFTLLFAVLLVTLGLLGWANIRLHRRHLEDSRLNAAQRLNEVIRRSTSYYMLRNDRPALQHIVETVGGQPTILSVRVYNSHGGIAFSTDRSEIGRDVGHAGLPAEGARIFHDGSQRIMAISTPIRNAPGCNGDCHAHPPDQTVLGMLGTNVSLAAADADVHASTWQFIFYSAAAILFTLLITAVFVWHFVHKPVRRLRDGTEKIGRGELGVQILVRSSDELGALASSFNQMSSQISDAQEEITAWARTLEDRVERKTAELSRAHDQMIQAEKLTSLGKLAAVVAHEINNPLSGILTYAKLLRKWIDRGENLEERAPEMRESLVLIERESRRCGDIVRNLLTFARAAPLNVSDFDVNVLVLQCMKLVEHKLDLGNITPGLDLAVDLPAVRGDAGQIEQLILALVMNGIEAMPREGNLRVTTRSTPDRNSVIVTVEDDGTGIAPDLLPRLFEPFVTTKDEGKGVGLGLAISRSIVDRHNGKIDVASEVGAGTSFIVTLPAASSPAAPITVAGLYPLEVTA